MNGSPTAACSVSGEFKDELDDDAFDDTTLGERNSSGAVITQQLGSWIIDRTR